MCVCKSSILLVPKENFKKVKINKNEIALVQIQASDRICKQFKLLLEMFCTDL